MLKDIYEIITSGEHLDLTLIGGLGAAALAGLLKSYRSLPPPDEVDDMLAEPEVFPFG